MSDAFSHPVCGARSDHSRKLTQALKGGAWENEHLVSASCLPLACGGAPQPEDGGHRPAVVHTGSL